MNYNPKPIYLSYFIVFLIFIKASLASELLNGKPFPQPSIGDYILSLPLLSPLLITARMFHFRQKTVSRKGLAVATTIFLPFAVMWIVSYLTSPHGLGIGPQLLVINTIILIALWVNSFYKTPITEKEKQSIKEFFRPTLPRLIFTTLLVISSIVTSFSYLKPFSYIPLGIIFTVSIHEFLVTLPLNIANELLFGSSVYNPIKELVTIIASSPIDYFLVCVLSNGYKKLQRLRSRGG